MILFPAPLLISRSAAEIRGEAELTLLSELTLSEDVDEESLRRIDENLQRFGGRVRQASKARDPAGDRRSRKGRRRRTCGRARSGEAGIVPYVKRAEIIIVHRQITSMPGKRTVSRSDCQAFEPLCCRGGQAGCPEEERIRNDIRCALRTSNRNPISRRGSAI